MSLRSKQLGAVEGSRCRVRFAAGSSCGRSRRPTAPGYWPSTASPRPLRSSGKAVTEGHRVAQDDDAYLFGQFGRDFTVTQTQGIDLNHLVELLGLPGPLSSSRISPWSSPQHRRPPSPIPPGVAARATPYRPATLARRLRSRGRGTPEPRPVEDQNRMKCPIAPRGTRAAMHVSGVPT